MTKKLVLLVFATCVSITSTAAQFQFPYVPDQKFTTGDFCSTEDPDYLGLAYPEQIAKCGRDVTYETKQRIYQLYKVRKECQKDYTIDHFIPLSIGGNNDLDNLWPESKAIKALRQDLELDLFQKVRDGRLTQAQAVSIIRREKLNPPIKQEMKFCR
jgi:hypothetical protein